MWALLLKWIANPKVLGISALVIALLGAFLWYGQYRSNQGYQSGQLTQLQTDKAEFQTQLSQYQQTLQQSQAQIQAEAQQIASLSETARTLSQAVSTLSTQRTQVSQQVAALPASQVQSDLEGKLGGPLSNSDILRKDDQIVSDYPLVLQQNTDLQKSVDTQNTEIATQQTEIANVEKQRDSAIAFNNVVIADYTKAYNAAQKHHSLFIKIITFGLVHDRHMNLPAPTTLKP